MNRDRTDEYILIGLLLIPTIWFALLVAPYADKGLFNVIPELGNIMNNPFHIKICDNTPKTILVFLVFYILGVGIYLSTLKNTRRLEEYGSAKWANTKQVICKQRV